MSYYQSGAIADIDAMMDRFDTELVANGWTKTEMNGLTGSPSVGCIRKERVYRANGTASDPTRFFIGMLRKRDGNNSYDAIQFYGFIGEKNFDTPVAVSSMSRSGGFMFVTTSSAHGCVTGDRVIINGATPDTLFDSDGATPIGSNQVGVGPITYQSPTQFYYADSGSPTTLSGTGGKVFPIYNHFGERMTSINNGNTLALFDSNMAVFMYTDQFRCAGIVNQGGNFNTFWFGETAREHVAADFRDRAFVSGGTVGPGAVTVTLSRNCANIRAGQPIWFIHPNSAVFERVTVTAKPAINQITVTLANAYPVGSLVGEDPLPCGIISNLGSSKTTTNLSSKTTRFAFFNNGTRVDGASQTFVCLVASNQTEGAADPDSVGNYALTDVWLQRTTVGTEAVRGPLIGLYGCALGTQNDQDLMRIGGDAVSDDYKVFVSALVDGTWAVAIGPDAIA